MAYFIHEENHKKDNQKHHMLVIRQQDRRFFRNLRIHISLQKDKLLQSFCKNRSVHIRIHSESLSTLESVDALES